MNHILQNKGITLVETIVAVTLLAAAIAGPMTLASQSLRASRDARSELVATHLAEEGIEIVHNMRDNNSANDHTSDHSLWLTNILTDCKGDGCIIDVTDHTLGVWGLAATIPCSNATCGAERQIYFNPDTGLYRQSASALLAPWQPTAFTRVLVVTPVDDPVTPVRQIHIAVTVTYVGYRNVVRTVVMGDDIYNWFPALN